MKKMLMVFIFLANIGFAFDAKGSNALLNTITKFSNNTNLAQIKGLKEALNIGVDVAVSSLKGSGFLDNPNAKIKLPKSLENITNVVSKLGGQKYINKLEKDINLAAGDAIEKSLPIFKKAILDININDAKTLLDGKSDSITHFFKRKTNANLAKAILPIVQKATKQNALSSSYESILDLYNSNSFLQNISSFFGSHVKPMDLDELNQYITNSAINEAYKAIAKEEAKIRKNPLSYANIAIKQVFGK